MNEKQKSTQARYILSQQDKHLAGEKRGGNRFYEATDGENMLGHNVHLIDITRHYGLMNTTPEFYAPGRAALILGAGHRLRNNCDG